MRARTCTLRARNEEVKNLDKFMGDEVLARIFSTISIYNNFNDEQKIGIIARATKLGQ